MHNLGTKDVTVQIFENNTSYAQVEADVGRVGGALNAWVRSERGSVERGSMSGI